MTIKFRGKHKSGFTVDILEPFTFPAGEAHIKGFDTTDLEDYDYFVVDIRGHNPQDLFHLSLFSQGITVAGSEAPLYVFMPYLPAARSDRGLPTGADVYAHFVNTMVFPNAVIALDPHSPYMTEVIENFVEFPFERIIKNEIAHKTDKLNVDHDYVGVIAPDKGAHDRAARAAAVLHVPVYTAGKTRDFETGKLTGFHMEDELPTEGKFLIVDDICDGGGTFLGLTAAIKKASPNVDLDLWVTHGVFSQGFVLLSQVFGTIHTTNSYYEAPFKELKPQDMSFLKVHDITPYLYGEVARIYAGAHQ